MIRRLWSFDPPLDEEEIEQRIAVFDVAVSDIEADVIAAFGDEAPTARDMNTYDEPEDPPTAQTSIYARHRYAADRDADDPYDADPRRSIRLPPTATTPTKPAIAARPSRQAARRPVRDGCRR